MNAKSSFLARPGRRKEVNRELVEVG